MAAAVPIRFARLVETGAHVESARAVAEKRADIAAVDAVTWRGITRHAEPMPMPMLRVLGQTRATPGTGLHHRREP